MRCHAAEVLEVVWCDELFAEFERKLPDVWGFSPEKARDTVRRFTAAAPGGRITPTAYGGLIGEMTGKDPDDHAMAAAARAGADVLLTHNLADFPTDDLGMNCTAMTPADLFAHLAELYPEDLAAVIRRSAAGLSRPPLTADEVLDKLAEVGLGEMATRLRPFMP